MYGTGSLRSGVGGNGTDTYGSVPVPVLPFEYSLAAASHCIPTSQTFVYERFAHTFPTSTNRAPLTPLRELGHQLSHPSYPGHIRSESWSAARVDGRARTPTVHPYLEISLAQAYRASPPEQRLSFCLHQNRTIITALQPKPKLLTILQTSVREPRGSYSLNTMSSQDFDSITQQPQIYIRQRRLSLAGTALANQFASTLSLQPSKLLHSPSSESTFSDHSLFSEHSLASSTTTFSGPTSSSDDFPRRNSFQTLTSLQSLTGTSQIIRASSPHSHHKQPTQTCFVSAHTAAVAPTRSPVSRFHSRRNAITLEDVKEPAYGPVRTVRGVRTAKPLIQNEIVHTQLQVPSQMPHCRCPASPPPKRCATLPYLIIPQRRQTMPTIAIRREDESNTPKIHGDLGDDLDFCCRGKCSPPEIRTIVYETIDLGSSASELSRRRGRSIQSLKLR